MGSFNNALRRLFFLPENLSDSQELYLYYRTQYKLINKVLNELALMENSPLIEIFDDPKALQNVINIYKYLKNKTVLQMDHEIQSNKNLLDDFNEQSAKALLQVSQTDTLKELHKHEIISSKLYVMLKKEFNEVTAQPVAGDAIDEKNNIDKN